MRSKILIVDNDEDVLNSLREHLTNEGYYVKTEKDPFTALKLIKTGGFFIVMVDINLDGMNGIEFLKRIKNYIVTTQVIMLSKKRRLNYLIDSIEAGADDYLVKPIEEMSVVKNIVDVANEKLNRWRSLNFDQN
ncbi:hypothetical protein DRQ09_08685 [candidate division KSB1 bacterium]|nr:MAG: hypothetical protein DRQ09_08685 [candidate division KSB1 bacterium]